MINIYRRGACPALKRSGKLLLTQNLVRNLTSRRHLSQISHQILPGTHQSLNRVGSEAIQHEVDILGIFCQLRASALSPVPASAGNTRTIYTDDFSWLRVDDHMLTVFNCIKRFITGGKGQNEIAREGIPIFSTNRQHMRNADSVIDIHQPVDRRYIMTLERAAQQGLQGTQELVWFGSKARVSLTPRSDMRMRRGIFGTECCSLFALCLAQQLRTALIS